MYSVIGGRGNKPRPLKDTRPCRSSICSTVVVKILVVLLQILLVLHNPDCNTFLITSIPHRSSMWRWKQFGVTRTGPHNSSALEQKARLSTKSIQIWAKRRDICARKAANCVTVDVSSRHLSVCHNSPSLCNGGQQASKYVLCFTAGCSDECAIDLGVNI